MIIREFYTYQGGTAVIIGDIFGHDLLLTIVTAVFIESTILSRSDKWDGYMEIQSSTFQSIVLIRIVDA